MIGHPPRNALGGLHRHLCEVLVTRSGPDRAEIAVELLEEVAAGVVGVSCGVHTADVPRMTRVPAREATAVLARGPGRFERGAGQ